MQARRTSAEVNRVASTSAPWQLASAYDNARHLLTLRRLVWDDWNLEHIARPGVTRDDVEAVCHHDPVLYRENYKERLVLLGRTQEGRVLAVVLGPVPNAPDGTYEPFTARPADRTDRRDYDRLKGGAEP